MQLVQGLANILSLLLSLYSFSIVLRIVLSWGSIGKTRFSKFNSFLTTITEPYLAIFRAFPGMQKGMLDFSPILALITLGILNNVLSFFAAQGKITFGIILALIVQAAGSVLNFFIVLFIILFAVRLFLEYRRTPNSIQYIAILDNLLSGMINRIHTLLFRGRETAARTLLLYSLISLIVLQIAFKAGISWLSAYLVQLPF